MGIIEKIATCFSFLFYQMPRDKKAVAIGRNFRRERRCFAEIDLLLTMGAMHVERNKLGIRSDLSHNLRKLMQA